MTLDVYATQNYIGKSHKSISPDICLISLQISEMKCTSQMCLFAGECKKT